MTGLSYEKIFVIGDELNFPPLPQAQFRSLHLIFSSNPFKFVAIQRFFFNKVKIEQTIEGRNSVDEFNNLYTRSATFFRAPRDCISKQGFDCSETAKRSVNKKRD